MLGAPPVVVLLGVDLAADAVIVFHQGSLVFRPMSGLLELKVLWDDVGCFYILNCFLLVDSLSTFLPPKYLVAAIDTNRLI